MTTPGQKRRRARKRRVKSKSTSAVVLHPQKAANPANRNVALEMFKPTANYEFLDPFSPVNPVKGRKPKQARGKRTAATIRADIPDYVLAITDPWCAEARGIKISDACRGLTGTFTGTDLFLLTTPSTGQFTDLNMVGRTVDPGIAVALFRPDPSCICVNAISSSNTFYWPNNIVYSTTSGALNAFGPGNGMATGASDIVVTDLAAIRPLFSQARMVAGGIRITATQSFSNVQGTIHVCPVPMDSVYSALTSAGAGIQNCWQAALPAGIQQMLTYPGYRRYPVSALEGDQIIALFTGYGPEQYEFRDINTAWGLTNSGQPPTYANRTGTDNTESSFGIYSLLVAIEGEVTTTGTTLVEIDYITHYECTPGPGVPATLIPSLAQRSPAYQPLMMAAAEDLITDIPPVSCRDDSSIAEEGFVRQLENLWNSACKTAASFKPVVDLGMQLAAFLL